MTAAGGALEGGSWTMNGAPIVLKIGMHAPLDLEARDLLNQIGNQLQSGGFQRQVHKISADDGVVEDIAPLFQTRSGGKGTLNLMNYSSEAVDSLLDAFDMAETDTEAQDAYHDLHKLLADELPYLFLWKLDTKSAWRMEVKGNTITPYFYFTEFDGWSMEGGDIAPTEGQ
jgi:ABC-type transport system substrate-binding protein